MSSAKSKPRIFLDSSVLIAALLSPTGGSFRLCKESRDRLMTLIINQYVFDEVTEVLEQKYDILDLYISEFTKIYSIAIHPHPSERVVKKFTSLIHPEDAPVLAGAAQAKVDFLISLDRKHFLTPIIRDAKFPFIICTPADFFSATSLYVLIYNEHAPMKAQSLVFPLLKQEGARGSYPLPLQRSNSQIEGRARKDMLCSLSRKL